MAGYVADGRREQVLADVERQRVDRLKELLNAPCGQQVFTALAGHLDPVAAHDLAGETDFSYNAVLRALQRADAAGLVVRSRSYGTGLRTWYWAITDAGIEFLTIITDRKDTT